MTNFSPLHRIPLKLAYKGEDAFDKIVSDEDFLEKVFEVSNRGTIYVWDDNKKGFSTFTEDTKRIGSNKILEVKNPKHKDVFLWHIDGVVYSDIQKCDCALINDTIIAFVEFKSNAKNFNNINTNLEYDKAISQLSTTINDFLRRCQKVGADVNKDFKIRAVAVFNRTIPQYNAMQKSKRRRFEKALHIPLDFSNKITME